MDRTVVEGWNFWLWCGERRGQAEAVDQAKLRSHSLLFLVPFAQIITFSQEKYLFYKQSSILPIGRRHSWLIYFSYLSLICSSVNPVHPLISVSTATTQITQIITLWPAVSDRLPPWTLHSIPRLARRILLNHQPHKDIPLPKTFPLPLIKTKPQTMTNLPHLPLISFQVLLPTDPETVHIGLPSSPWIQQTSSCLWTFLEPLWTIPRLALHFYSDLCSNVTSSEGSSPIPLLRVGFLLLSLSLTFVVFSSSTFSTI